MQATPSLAGPAVVPADPSLDAAVPTRRLVAVRDRFGIDVDWRVPAFDEPTDLVPDVDPAYRFDRPLTLAVLAGFAHGRRVLVQGMHGTGKTSTIEQVAARLNWPVIRVNLDGQISRADLVGHDAVVLRDHKQVTEFQPGILPWAVARPVALVLDEYDAGRPEVMFVLQRLLERDGAFTLLERATVIRPHPDFRLFATANTPGLGDDTGLYRGVQRLNQAQLDRWDIVAAAHYPPPGTEVAIVQGHVPALAGPEHVGVLTAMVTVANLTRQGFAAGDLSTVMSPRTVICWAENLQIFGDIGEAFRLAFLNRCDPSERHLVAEYVQRALDIELDVDDPACSPAGTIAPGALAPEADEPVRSDSPTDP